MRKQPRKQLPTLQVPRVHILSGITATTAAAYTPSATANSTAALTTTSSGRVLNGFPV